MADSLSFGVIVTDGNDNSRFGIIAEMRKTDCRVFYPCSGKSTWRLLAELKAAPTGETEGKLEWRITSLLSLLGAIDMEFRSLSPSRHRLIATHRAITPGTVDAVRSTVGPQLLNYVMRPAGMSRMQTILEFTFP